MNQFVNPTFFQNGQFLSPCPFYNYWQHSQYSRPFCITLAAADLKNHLRMLWEQHVMWTRLVIISLVFGLPDADAATKRLLQNPKDFGAALKPLYGDANASRFTALFTEHLVIAAQLVKAAKAGDSRAAADAEKRWYANADEIADFLASINPYWSRVSWKAMLYDHLKMTKAEAVDMLTGKYQDGVAQYDEIEKQALGMADVMTEGILSQFPGKFV